MTSRSMSVRSSSVARTLVCVVLLLLQLVAPSEALLKEDVGKLDFLMATSGGIPATVAQTLDSLVLLTERGYLTARNVTDGSLLWRRHVAESHDHVVVAAQAHIVATLHTQRRWIQVWDATHGHLYWEQPITFTTKHIQIIVQDPTDEANTLETDSTMTRTHKTSPEIYLRAGDSYWDATTGTPLEHKPTTVNTIANNQPTALPATRDSKVNCGDAVAYIGQQALVIESPHHENVHGEKAFFPNDQVAQIVLTTCSPTYMEVYVQSQRGTTAFYQVSLTTTTTTAAAVVYPTVSLAWKQEEGLAFGQMALLMDASHNEQRKTATELLSFYARLQSQVQTFTTNKVKRSRDAAFGFGKMAIVLSNHAVYGIPTTGTHRQQVTYRLDLTTDAEYHKLIHGSGNALTHDGLHTRHVLVLSVARKRITWNCFDGVEGASLGIGEEQISSKVVQIIPIASANDECRQAVLLVLEDDSVVSLPPSSVHETDKLDIYGHIVRKEDAKVETFHLQGNLQSGIAKSPIGKAIFPGEHIVAAAYPKRDEKIKSPYNIMGDDSLLLKYINPHLGVFISVQHGDNRSLAAKVPALQKKSTGSARKPAGAAKGATAASTETTEEGEEEPNLFVNLVDLVSGRVIYRISHSNAVLSPAPSILMSENWIFYTFTNGKTKRAQIGVLSLYEGLIEKSGLTAFGSPERSTEFTSLDTRDSPLVVSKSYSMATGISALGITSTHEGISSQHVVMASVDGSVISMNRKMLEPRRPLGDVKESEKKEGIFQYHELIPVSPLMKLSHTYQVDGVTGIVTAPTDLESQTLVLAYGGPDIFFTRTSPSRGFDLLPDNFNKPLLSLVVLVLLIGLFVVQRMAKRRVIKQGWA